MSSHVMASSGFTIAEVLLVVLVMGMLVAIFVPSFQGIRGDAMATKAVADLRTIQTAIEIYINDQDTPPGSLDALLLLGTDRILNDVPVDPFSGIAEERYRYVKESSPAWAVDTLYAAFSVGLDGVAGVEVSGFEGDGILSPSEAGDDIYVTNARRQ